MKKYIVPKGVEEFFVSSIKNDEIEEITFEKGSKCKRIFGIEDYEGLKRIVIPKSVEIIEGFNECLDLKDIIFEEGSNIGEIYGFNGCISLEKIDFPTNAHIFYIGKKIRKENSLLNDYEEAFSDCEHLKEVNFGKNGKSSYQFICGFNNCGSLKKITIPKISDRFIGLNNCSDLEEVKFEEGYFYENFEGLNNCSKLKVMNLPISFRNLVIHNEKSALEKVNFIKSKDSYNILHNLYSFQGCSSLKEITIPGTIEKFCDINCDKITIEDGKNLEEFSTSGGSFYPNVKLIGRCKEINILGNISSNKILDIFSKFKGKILNDGKEITKIGDVKNYIVSKDIKIFNTIILSNTGVKEISFEKGSQCKEIIGEDCFEGGFDNLKKITIPSSVEKISGFNGCESLEELIFESNSKCKIIKGFEFTSLKKLFIPKSVKRIEGSDISEDNVGAFSNSFEKPTLKEVAFEDGFDGEYIYAFGATALEKFHVPRVEMFFGLLGCPNLKKVTFDNSGKLKELGDFTACKRLEEITIPKSVKKLSLFTWQADNPSYIKKVNFEEGSQCEIITNFNACEDLEELNLPASVKIINDGLICCEKLKRITFANGSQLEKFSNINLEDLEELKEIIFKGEWKNLSKLNKIFGDFSKLVKIQQNGERKTKDGRKIKRVLIGREPVDMIEL